MTVRLLVDQIADDHRRADTAEGRRQVGNGAVSRFFVIAAVDIDRTLLLFRVLDVVFASAGYPDAS